MEFEMLSIGPEAVEGHFSEADPLNCVTPA